MSPSIGNYSACVIGGVVHKIPLPTASPTEKTMEDTQITPPISYDTGNSDALVQCSGTIPIYISGSNNCYRNVK